MERALRSLAPALRGADSSGTAPVWECVVIDNDSRDGTPEAVERDANWARVIRTGANLGYAKAVNRGIAATAGASVLVTNPDCVWAPGAIRALLAWLGGHSRCAIAAPRILNPDGTLEYSARAYPDSFTFLFNRYSLLTRMWPGNPWSRRYLLSDWDHATPRSVDWVSGAAMLARREAIAAVGGMDEAFFMFNEDVDWCRRMKTAGWAVTYVPGARCVHHVGASRKKVASRVILERHRGMIHYFHKHHPTHPVVTFCADALILMRAGLMLTANALRPR